MNAQEARIALSHLTNMQCPRADAPGPAGIRQISLPWPAVPARDLRFGDQPTYVAPLGEWPESADHAPRRMLLCADGGADAPDTVSIHEGATAPVADPPRVTAECFAQSDTEGFKWERHRLRIETAGRSIALAMGLRTGGEVHWWEACRLVIEEQTPFCTVVRMGGCIPHQLVDLDLVRNTRGYSYPFLHKHNWLSADLFVRIYANGVCEVFAHHINSRIFDEGCDLEDTVPLIGLQTDATGDMRALAGEWDGSINEINLGGVRFDLAEASRLATATQPGRMDVEGDFLAWQPYMGVDVFGGDCPTQRTGDPFVHHAEDRLFPRGMARTLRFSFSLADDRSPRIARYVAPYWWYGHHREITPHPHLPVHVDTFDVRLDRCREWLRTHGVDRGFEAGSMPRHIHNTEGRHEPGWEGEIPHGQFLLAYRTADAVDFQLAMRSAYHYTDVAIDHAANLTRMHGFPPTSYAPTMNRVLGVVSAYLENGDPYLLNTAEAIVESGHRQHLSAWPRLAVGRDGYYVRGAVMLYRYFNNNHFRRIARQGAMTVVHSQRDNGSFGDQGGGTGIHQWGGYITKPWMGTLATGGLIDYLDLFPDDKPLADCVQKFGDWLMKNRWTRDGYTGWSYQHEYDGKPKHFDIYSSQWLELPAPTPWHQDSLARVLGYCSFNTDDPAYIDAYLESLNHVEKKITEGAYQLGGADHPVSCALQFLPWFASNLYRATLTDQGVTTAPRSEWKPAGVRIEQPEPSPHPL